MPLGKEIGLGPGHIVLDGDSVGTQTPQQPLPTFGPCLLWPNGRPSQQLLSSCFVTHCLSSHFVSFTNMTIFLSGAMNRNTLPYISHIRR